MDKDERVLDEIIQEFYQDKQQLDYYKEQTDTNNKYIKDLMKKLNKTEFEATGNLLAKISIQNRESFDENKLLQKIKDLKVDGIIKTVEVVDMEALEDAIYNERLDASELTNCKISKEVVTLKVTERK